MPQKIISFRMSNGTAAPPLPLPPVLSNIHSYIGLEHHQPQCCGAHQKTTQYLAVEKGSSRIIR